MNSLFQRKPIEAQSDRGLIRSLTAFDLVMLAIGAVIGAGIFGAIGSAAAGQVDAAGHVIRAGAGPALVLSFVLAGMACAFAGLCYAELAAMIPQAGSAYAYSYATLGEIVAWIIGWDLILEYAVGNVAVAISWGDYFKSVFSGWIEFPAWLTTGYRTALLSPDPAVHGLLEKAPHLFGVPVLINVPAFAIVALITGLLLMGVRESARANNILVFIKLAILGLFIVMGMQHINTANYHPFAPAGLSGIGQGAAIVFFAYIGFDAISTAAEETRNPQRNLPIGIMGGLAVCTVIYIVVGVVLTGMVPASALGASADPLAYALKATGLASISRIVALGALFSLSAVLLVFQYGQPRIFFGMARDGLLPAWAAKIHPKSRIPHVTTLVTGVFVALWALIGDAGETYDLTNIGTLFAFILVCIGVVVLRYKEPDRPRPFRVPFVHVTAALGVLMCGYLMRHLPVETWIRFVAWLVIGVALYAAYGYRHSVLRTGKPVITETLD
ncbi:MAG TPA: amino acid permease [Gemmatimonadales bacterium]